MISLGPRRDEENGFSAFRLAYRLLGVHYRKADFG